MSGLAERQNVCVRMALCAVLWVFSGCEVSGSSASPPAPAATPWADMLDAVNVARSQARRCGRDRFSAVPPLTWSSRLEVAARIHSRDMVRMGRLSHVGSDGSRVGQRASDVGYAWWRVGENIAKGQHSVEEVMEGWLSSPSHCSAIMDPDYTQLGAAETERYWTQVFGRPRS